MSKQLNAPDSEPNDALVSGFYRSLPQAEPGAELDARIRAGVLAELGMTHEAAPRPAEEPARAQGAAVIALPPRRRRWLPSMALAATVVFGIGLGVNWLGIERRAASPAIPTETDASAPMASAAPAADVMPPAASAPAQMAASSPALDPTPVVAAPAPARVQETAEAHADKTAPSVQKSAQKREDQSAGAGNASLAARPPVTAPAGAAVADAADAPRAVSKRAQPAASALADPGEAQKKMDTSAAEPLAAKQSYSRAKAADRAVLTEEAQRAATPAAAPPPPALQRSETGAAAEPAPLPPPMSKPETAAPKAVVSAAPVALGAVAPAAPVSLKAVRDLLKQGNPDAARQLLRRWQAQHPQETVPRDLQFLLLPDPHAPEASVP